MTAQSPTQAAELSSLVPSECLGWTIEEDQTFNADTIFSYVDGAGEVYRSYNMKSLFARRFTQAGKPALVVDLFDMGAAEDAFGVFTHDLDGEDAGVGQGSNYKGGLLSFWKDRYFASVYAEEETPETKQAVYKLSKEIEGAIRAEGKRPALLSLLPPQGIDDRFVRYFHNYSVLNYHFFVSDKNILLLNQKTSAVLAPYKDNDARSYLLLIRYPDPEKSAEAFGSFSRAYMPDAGIEGVVQKEDGKWTAARRKGDLIILVFQGPSRSQAEDLIEKVEAGI